jgi:predicted kinase
MIPIIKDKSWSSLQKYDWINDMHGVPQSPVHHAEGDVAIHTQMVLGELSKLPEYISLPDVAQEIVWIATLMHDIEKRSTTKVEESGAIVSPGHSKKGAHTANGILYRDFNVPFEWRMEIVGLIRHHGLPLWSMEKQEPAKAVIKASMEVNTEWLYILAKADALGRKCADKEDLLERLEFFKELCLEQQCWGTSKHFPSNLSKFTYFRKDDQSPDFVPFENTLSEVIILSGIAGSGKDRYLALNHPKLAVVSLDRLRREHKIDRNDSKGNGRIIQQAIEQAKQYLRNGESFAWNATNITRQMREQLIDQFTVYKARITLVYVEVPYSKLLSQNKAREYCLPDSVIERMIDKLEVPNMWEAHDLKYCVR